MKTKTKLLLLFIGITGAMADINFWLSKYAEKKFKDKENGCFYSWRHGRIRYTVSGSGEPILLVPGADIGGGLHEWEKMISQLSRHYKVYAIDLLGFGFSDKPNLTYSSYLYVSLLNDFIKDCIGESVNIIANGNSSSIAAAAYVFSPDLYKKMILVTEKKQYKNPLLGRFMEIPIYGTFFYNVLSFATSFNKYPDVKTAFDRSVISYYGGAGNKYPIAAMMSKMLDVDLEKFLPKINIPVRIVDTKTPHIDNHGGFYKTCRDFLRETPTVKGV